MDEHAELEVLPFALGGRRQSEARGGQRGHRASCQAERRSGECDRGQLLEHFASGRHQWSSILVESLLPSFGAGVRSGGATKPRRNARPWARNIARITAVVSS